MLETTISQYLQSNRRLVIPQLGAFLVKEPDHKIIFSSLLTRDDGVLRTLLSAQGISEVEVSGMIDRIVFDIRFAIDNNQAYTLAGIGTFSAETNGTIHFEQWIQQAATITPTEEEINQSTETDPPAVATENTATEPLAQEEESKVSMFEPDPDLEGLSYGGNNKRRRSSGGGKARRIDWWMVIGIAALALAAGAILYGMLRDGAGSNSEQFSEEFYAE